MSNLIPTTENSPGIPGCVFTYDDGRKCMALNVQARNLCVRHYQQLRRLGAFDRQRAATDAEALANISSDRLAKARDILERSAPLAARHLKLAAKVAAAKGDAKPALAILLHTKALQPLAGSASATGPAQQPIIQIGFALAGIAPTTPSTPTIIRTERIDQRQTD